MSTALVTGANRGIGFAIAQGLAQRIGTRVLVGSRRLQDAEDAAGRIGHGSIGVELALDDPERTRETAENLLLEHGPIDILINNAAVMTEGSAIELDPGGLSRSLAINAVSPFALIRALGPPMQQRRHGRIVNVSSNWGSFAEGLEGPTAYSVSKAALNAITVSAARALGPDVKVNAMCPGWVRTRMGGDAAIRSPEEGADTAIWLATLPDDGPTGGFFRDRQRLEW
jgi:NAD(P)-dependent dehydrogenase (short-subunit alcohol dehydrogenase family)